MKKTTNERRYERFICNGHVDVMFAVDGVPSAAKILDLSAEGCLVELEEPHNLARDAKVELTFEVNQLHFRVWALAKSIRSDTLIGFQFPELSKRTKTQLQDLVEELGAEAHKNHPLKPKQSGS